MTGLLEKYIKVTIRCNLILENIEGPVFPQSHPLIVAPKIRKALLMRNVKDHPDIQRLLLDDHMMAYGNHRPILTTALGVLSGEITDLLTVETCRFADEMIPWPYQGNRNELR